MRIALVAVVVAAASPVLAQPITSPETCEIKIVRAPDDVALDIEAWVRAEPRCNTSLELRVIPTDGGYYLFARRPDGRLHERLVPDGQSAGVLIASWMADDWVEPPPAPRPAPVIVNPFEIGAPGEVAVRAQAPRATPPSTKWLSLSIMTRPQSGGGTGLRAELDLFAHGAWTLGAAASWSGSTSELFDAYGMQTNYLHSSDSKVMAVLARTSRWGGWGLRVGVGIGAMHTSIEADVPSTTGWQVLEDDGWFATVEASALITRTLGKSWALSAGPILSRISQDFYDMPEQTGTAYPIDGTVVRQDVELMLGAGLRYRL